MRPLVGASIIFHTRGDNKNARTAVHVVVLARSNTSATPDQRSDFVSRLLDERGYEPGGDLPGEEATPYLAFGLGLGADETLDEGSNRELPLSLEAFDIDLDNVALPAAAIHILPHDHDRWIFDYQVTYEYTDPANADGKRHVFTSRTNGVILDQDNAKHEAVYQGRPFPAVAPPTAPPTAPPLSFAAVDHLEPLAKRIPVPYVQRKFDESVNGRVGPITGQNPRLPNIALDSSGDFAEDITPGSYADLHSLVPTAGAPAYVSAPLSLGQLDYGYYLHGIDGASLAPALDPAAPPTPLTVTLDLETSGGPELISKAVGLFGPQGRRGWARCSC